MAGLFSAGPGSGAERKVSMAQRALPRPGEFYRHFKNRLYQIVAVAYQADDEAPVVVYQALYGDFRVWVRPLEEFMSETDRTKYPEAEQRYRFELVTPETAARLPGETVPMETVTEKVGPNTAWSARKSSAEISAPAGPEAAAAESALVPAAGDRRLLLEFLDTDDLQEKKAILRGGMARLTQGDLDGIYTVYGIQRFPGDIREQADGIIRYLSMRSHYEGDRLRKKWE